MKYMLWKSNFHSLQWSFVSMVTLKLEFSRLNSTNYIEGSETTGGGQYSLFLECRTHEEMTGADQVQPAVKDQLCFKTIHN